MPAPDYVAWSTTPHGFATLTAIANVPDDYELWEGVSRAASWPSDAAFHMDPAYPRDVLLPDAVHSRGGDGLPLVSPALREAIAAFDPPDVEYLPVTIYDHKGRVASDEHVIAHSCHVVDALDHDAMEILWNPLDPETIMSCQGVVLDPARLEGAPALFRPKNMEGRVFVRHDVADALEATESTGLRFVPLEEVIT